MELTNLQNLLEEIDYLKEAEELLRAIYQEMDYYKLYGILRKRYDGATLCSKLTNHFSFDDSE